MRLLTLSAAVCLLLLSCAEHIAPGVVIDSRLSSYVPPKSNLLVGFDLDKIKQSAIFQRHQADIQLPQLNQLPAEIGMDPRRDLSSLLLAWNGSDALAIVLGNYSPQKIQQRLDNTAKTEKYNNLALYGDGRHDIVFLPKGVALAGSPVLLKQALNEHAADTGGIPEGLRAQLERVNKAAQIWAVSSGILALNQFSLRSDTASALANLVDYINATAVGITFSSGVNLDARISCVSEEGSQRVHDALRGIVGLARLNTKDDQLDQLKIWDCIKVERQASEVHVTADLPADVADRALALSKDLFKGYSSRLR